MEWFSSDSLRHFYSHTAQMLFLKIANMLEKVNFTFEAEKRFNHFH